jgi:hypothetical protein
MERIRTLAVLVMLVLISPGTGSGQEIGIIGGSSSRPLGPPISPTSAQGDVRAFWPEPLPLLSTYPVTPSVQPLPQLRLPQLPAHGILIVPLPISTIPLNTIMLFGPFSPQLYFGGSLTLPVDRPFLGSRLGPLVFTSNGLVRPNLTEPVCPANLVPPTDPLSLFLGRFR